MVKWLRGLWRAISGNSEHMTRDAYTTMQEASQEPWAMFEVDGFEDGGGRIKVKFAWNQRFIEELDKLGFTAESQEDTVQLFFYTSQMKPGELTGGDPTVQTSDLPNLSANANRMIR